MPIDLLGARHVPNNSYYVQKERSGVSTAAPVIVWFSGLLRLLPVLATAQRDA